MLKKFNQLLDILSNYMASRKGLLPMTGVVLVVINWVLQFFPVLGWIVTSNTFLHLGILLAVVGFLLAWAL